MKFIDEIRWRGMLHSFTPGVEELLDKEMVTAYIGVDPTADSLHIGHLAAIMMLKLFQKSGHKPILVMGGATGMIGDPSGKSAERNLLDEQTLRKNQEGIYKQMQRFLDFSEIPNKAEIVNNYDWMKNFSFLDFIRDIGKHITVNYMIAKDSVKQRMDKDGAGLSFTEFSYQLVQGYDFLYLFENKNCKLQMGGSDQWGNITTGTELIRKKLGSEAFALTCPLITKSDGKKFGKTEKGNVWLDSQLTSPYEFYQFWINTSDEDAEKYIKIFTFLSKEEIENLISEHQKSPHLRILQKKLASEITLMVHSEKDLQIAMNASEILFGKATKELLVSLDEKTFLSVFEGVPQHFVSKNELENGIDICELLSVKTSIFPSKSEIRRTIQAGGLLINQNKISDANISISLKDSLNERYILIQKGKKNNFLIILS